MQKFSEFIKETTGSNFSKPREIDFLLRQYNEYISNLKDLKIKILVPDSNFRLSINYIVIHLNKTAYQKYVDRIVECEFVNSAKLTSKFSIYVNLGNFFEAKDCLNEIALSIGAEIVHIEYGD